MELCDGPLLSERERERERGRKVNLALRGLPSTTGGKKDDHPTHQLCSLLYFKAAFLPGAHCTGVAAIGTVSAVSRLRMTEQQQPGRNMLA